MEGLDQWLFETVEERNGQLFGNGLAEVKLIEPF